MATCLLRLSALLAGFFALIASAIASDEQSANRHAQARYWYWAAIALLCFALACAGAA
jgi:hypothetical protein